MKHALQHIAIAVLSLMLLSCSGEMVEQPEGIDVSRYQGDINWGNVKKDGTAFAYIKVSEGITITDEKLAQNWAGAKRNDIIQGGYHTFVPGDDGIKQAQNFISSLNKIGSSHIGTLPPALDIEPIRNASMNEVKAEVQNWLQYVQSTLGCKPVIYTSPESWDDELPGEFGEYKLWLADYTPPPELPSGWKDWTFWQYTNKDKEEGATNSDIDKDHFNGSRFALELTLCTGL